MKLATAASSQRDAPGGKFFVYYAVLEIGMDIVQLEAAVMVPCQPISRRCAGSLSPTEERELKNSGFGTSYAQSGQSLHHDFHSNKGGGCYLFVSEVTAY
ncbi:MAG: hypothetical protein JO166_10185 [Deltaproteobacteria bacterium]|nr:hypothetical protein [Deltaproteobacteria bacterium]